MISKTASCPGIKFPAGRSKQPKLLLSKVLGSARGVIVPHQLVKAVGDVMVISKSAVPSGAHAEEQGEA